MYSLVGSKERKIFRTRILSTSRASSGILTRLPHACIMCLFQIVECPIQFHHDKKTFKNMTRIGYNQTLESFQHNKIRTLSLECVLFKIFKNVFTIDFGCVYI